MCKMYGNVLAASNDSELMLDHCASFSLFVFTILLDKLYLGENEVIDRVCLSG